MPSASWMVPRETVAIPTTTSVSASNILATVTDDKSLIVVAYTLSLQVIAGSGGRLVILYYYIFTDACGLLSIEGPRLHLYGSSGGGEDFILDVVGSCGEHAYAIGPLVVDEDVEDAAVEIDM